MMAANDDTPVSFLCSTDTSIYFGENLTDWTEDSFARTAYQKTKWFKSEEKFLILKDGELQRSDKCGDKFCIQYYRSSLNTHCTEGKPVMFYINHDGRNQVVCCNDKKEVHPVNMDIPRDIEVDSHEAIFYMVPKTSNVCMFESSLHASHYLGFEDNGSAGCDKLILRSADQVDARVEITLEDKGVNAAV